jgi:Cu/Ag efflux pump CusA
MVLAGFAAALAIVIDDAVIGVDAIRQRLRERHDADESWSIRVVIADAMASIGGSLGYATLIVLVAALPALALSGVPGALAKPLVLSYVLAVVASLVVTFTVTPALALLLLGSESARARSRGLMPSVGRAYDRLIARHVKRPRRAYAAVGILLLCGLAVLPQLTSHATLPRLQDRDLLVRWQAIPGTSITEMSRITAAATQELRAVPGVRDVGSHVGRAIMSDQTANVNTADIWVDVAQSADYGSTVSAVDRTVRGYGPARRRPDLRAGAHRRDRERHPC